MTIEEAIKVIRDTEARWERKVDAIGWLINSHDTPLSYFVECLSIPGIPQEQASIALHKRTHRPTRGKGPNSIITDTEDWKAYLAGH